MLEQTIVPIDFITAYAFQEERVHHKTNSSAQYVMCATSHVVVHVSTSPPGVAAVPYPEIHPPQLCNVARSGAQGIYN